MILNTSHIKNEIELIQGYNLILYKHYKDFEVKIIDNITGEYLIIDNDFISKKPLVLKDYIPLCQETINKLLQGFQLSQLSIQ